MNNPRPEVNELYFNKQLIQKCKTLNRFKWEDLLSETYGQLIKMDSQKLDKAIKGNYLLFVALTIAFRISRGRVPNTGIFYKSDTIIYTEFDSAYDETQTSYSDIFDTISDHLNLDQIEAIISDLHWYHSILFTYRYIDGLSIKEIHEKTGINIVTLYNTLSQIRKKIKKEINDRNNNDK